MISDNYTQGTSDRTSPNAANPALNHTCECPLTLPQRYALSMARQPKKHLLASLLVSIILSTITILYGNLKISVDVSGWWTRNTLISNRSTQQLLIKNFRTRLFRDDNGQVWKKLTEEMQPDWQKTTWKEDTGQEDEGESKGNSTRRMEDIICNGSWYGSEFMTNTAELPLVSIWKTLDAEFVNSKRSALDADALYELCKAEEKTLQFLEEEDLCFKCPISYDGASSRSKCIQPFSLVLMSRLYLDSTNGNFEIFQRRADEVLIDSEFLLPSIDCTSLRDQWTPTIHAQFTSMLQSCSNYAMERAELKPITNGQYTKCVLPLPIMTVVDDRFPLSNPPIIRYTSSIYATKNDEASIKAMYRADQSNQFHTGSSESSILQGLYEAGINSIYATPKQSFYELYLEEILPKDLGLAIGSVIATAICILIHTRSPFLTLMGLAQIVLAFPLSYFVYYFVFGLEFFPIVNFNGIFIVFALGADDIFVAVDKWRNIRLQLPQITTEQVATLALPDAAYAMFITSITTAVAFFGTAVMNVPTVVCFAIFCGLIVSIDYVLNVLLVFPSLCLYDRWLIGGSRSLWLSLDSCWRRGRGGNEKERKKSLVSMDARLHKQMLNETGGEPNATDLGIEEPNSFCASQVMTENGNDDTANESISAKEEGEFSQVSVGKQDDVSTNELSDTQIIPIDNPILIHRILDAYYKVLHKLRWPLLVLSIGAIIACSFITTQVRPPDTPDPPFLPASNPYEMHRMWSKHLLSTGLYNSKNGELSFIWGVTPADTGDYLNPDEWTTLVLDDTFYPRTEIAQMYFLNVCDKLFEGGFTNKVSDDYECPMKAFDKWLVKQSNSTSPSNEYKHCKGASSVPVPPDVFDSCMIAWSKLVKNMDVLQNQGLVKVMMIQAGSNTTFSYPFYEQTQEWHNLESWLEKEKEIAPDGVRNFFFSTYDFWFMDTLKNMMSSAKKSAGIAMACASIMIVLTSRSLVLMLFSTIAIAYVLLASTACLVHMGWTLGLFESILFAILIGVGCDFVLHFGHAYTFFHGNVSRNQRTRFALLHMGPSVLGSGFTTLLTAIIMMFTELTYFRKFAVMLAMAIVHSIIGSFVVFLTLCDCLGPNDPQNLFYRVQKQFNIFWSSQKCCAKPSSGMDQPINRNIVLENADG